MRLLMSPLSLAVFTTKLTPGVTIESRLTAGSWATFVNMAAQACDVHWHPDELLMNGKEEYALLILNGSSVTNHMDHFTKLWTKATIRLAVDGGANYLPLDSAYKPDIISGDFDSIRDSTKKYFATLGSNIIETPDQDETDFMKAVKIVEEKRANGNLKVKFILALGSISGRPDHILSNFSTMYKMAHTVPIILYEIGQSISWVLGGRKKHFIYPGPLLIHDEETREVTWCSLVPLNGPVIVTTSGLRWNLDNFTLNFEGLISTSNEFDHQSKGNVVTIETDKSVLWSMKDILWTEAK